MKRRFVFAVLIVAGVLATSRQAAAQDHLTQQLFDQLAKASTEVLQAHYAYRAEELATYRPIYGEPFADEDRLSFLQQINAFLKDTLAKRGVSVKTPGGGPGGSGASGGVSGGSGGGSGVPDNFGRGPRNTQPMGSTSPPGNTLKTPSSSGNSSLVVPLLVVLTAAQLAKCTSDGMGLPECAKALATNFIAGLPAAAAGAAIAVVSPVGATILTGIAVAESAGTLLVTSYEVGSETLATARDATADYQREQARQRQREANAQRMTPEKMQLLVNQYRARIEAARIAPEPRDAITQAMSGLQRMVEKTRGDLARFRDLNSVPKLATDMCRDRSKNPVAYAADADTRVATMETLASSIAVKVSDASSLVAACTGGDQARRAKDRYASAQQDFTRLEQTGRDARADLLDAVKFFANVKAARQNQPLLSRALATLETDVTDANAAADRVIAAVNAFAPTLDKAHAAGAGLALSVATIREAFPPNPPPHIAQALKAIDHSYVETVATWMGEDRLEALKNQAGDEVSRVDGLRRQATEELADLNACAGMPDDMPDALRQHLSTLGTQIDAGFKQGDAALAAGNEIPGKADDCLRRSTTTPPPAQPSSGGGQLTGACQGTIGVNPLEGTAGSPLAVRVSIAPPAADSVTRVTADNPGCNSADCREMRLLRLGEYSSLLRFSAPAGGVSSTFHLSITVFTGDRAICSGQSPELKVLR